jgi:hypothetical protein
MSSHLLSLGCRDVSGLGRILPVRGKLTLDGEPVTAPTTVVLVQPDTAKGNTSPLEPAGAVDSQGNYTPLTKGKNGAPPGWYRVIVTATERQEESGGVRRRGRPVPRSLLSRKYGQSSTTDLTVEVVEGPAPGAYDLKLAR